MELLPIISHDLQTGIEKTPTYQVEVISIEH